LRDGDEIEMGLRDLLAQVQPSLLPAESAEVERLIAAGTMRQAVEAFCRFAQAGQHPLPMQARAMIFKLADRLGIDPAALGLLG